MPEPLWGCYEELRPDQLQAIVQAAPVVYWPLGLLEHHGWHLPVGFDGVKAHRLCRRFAQSTGGAVLPVMWWGGGGGHGPYKWTLYQPLEATEAIFANSVRLLITFGFRCFVLLAGHYPWRSVLKSALPAIEQEHPEVLFIWGTEADIGAPEARLKGDHAARWETSYGLALLPELVDMGALRTGRKESEAWPGGVRPKFEEEHPRYNADYPLFAQHGEDARTASGEEAEEMLSRLTDHIAARVAAHLGKGK